ncbi:MAG: type II toxin-antitoxin system PemK/MazF family toxin [Acidobacteria bacterium]|nr:type II toxin-antitoxin system PemK/MazF family toxin [Acidobacteriota bacterium]
MQAGDVVLTPVPQADGTVKNRPAIVLREMPGYRDVLVCGVSTQLHQYMPGFDDLISPADADFASSGLVTSSLIRLGFLAVVPRRNILGTIGAIAPERPQRLVQALSNYLLRNLGS